MEENELDCFNMAKKHFNTMDLYKTDDDFESMEDIKCDWTGETIKKIYKIPTFDLKGWTGNYGSPSVALNGLMSKVYNNDDKYYEDIQEMIDFFEMSIFREEGYENVKYTIQMAPNKKQLLKLGLEEYHKLYGHDEQIKIFKQDFPYFYLC